MKPSLDDVLKPIIVCPLCKTGLAWGVDATNCETCGQRFRCSQKGVWDFMPTYPSFLEEVVNFEWKRGQCHYEEWAVKLSERDDYVSYLREIDSVREIYAEEFKLAGYILDVGGGQGRLRHFLPSSTTYLSVDPFADCFDGLERCHNLLKAYPCLRQPCNFLRASAESLPLRSNAFDYVHIRSVLDHLADPLRAILEARRVLRPKGVLLIGIHVTGGKSSLACGEGFAHLLSRLQKKVRDEGMMATVEATVKRLIGRSERDEHVWHPSYPDLIELLQATNFVLEKEHWQKAPNDHVIYIQARKF